ncbi:MAG: hypothetical protein ACOYJD_01335 [Christensenellales bacterium]|jgi:hypothetical protein
MSVISIGGLVAIFPLLVFMLRYERATQEFSIFIYLFMLFIIGLLIKHIWDLIYGIYSYNVRIDEKGVEYHKRKEIYSLKWDEIHAIAIYPNPYAKITKSCMICFIGGESYPLLFRNIKQFDEHFFGVQYREQIIHEIQKYWNDTIHGADILMKKAAE